MTVLPYVTVLEGVSPDTAVVLRVDGPLAGPAVERLRVELDELVATRPARLAVDLADCPFVDAGALAVLLDVHRRVSRAGGVLTLQGCVPRVLRLLSLTGLRGVFDLADAG